MNLDSKVELDGEREVDLWTQLVDFVSGDAEEDGLRTRCVVVLSQFGEAMMFFLCDLNKNHR